MPPYAAFHLGLNGLPKYPFRGSVPKGLSAYNAECCKKTKS